MPCGCWSPADPPDCCDPGEPFCDALGIMRSVSMTAAPKSIESTRPPPPDGERIFDDSPVTPHKLSSPFVNYRRVASVGFLLGACEQRDGKPKEEGEGEERGEAGVRDRDRVGGAPNCQSLCSAFFLRPRLSDSLSLSALLSADLTYGNDFGDGA